MNRKGRGQKWKHVIMAWHGITNANEGLGDTSRVTTPERGDGRRDNHRKGGRGCGKSSPDKQPHPERHRAQSPHTTASVSVREGKASVYVLL